MNQFDQDLASEKTDEVNPSMENPFIVGNSVAHSVGDRLPPELVLALAEGWWEVFMWIL